MSEANCCNVVRKRLSLLNCLAPVAAECTWGIGCVFVEGGSIEFVKILGLSCLLTRIGDDWVEATSLSFPEFGSKQNFEYFGNSSDGDSKAVCWWVYLVSVSIWQLVVDLGELINVFATK